MAKAAKRQASASSPKILINKSVVPQMKQRTFLRDYVASISPSFACGWGLGRRWQVGRDKHTWQYLAFTASKCFQYVVSFYSVNTPVELSLSSPFFRCRNWSTGCFIESTFHAAKAQNLHDVDMVGLWKKLGAQQAFQIMFKNKLLV